MGKLHGKSSRIYMNATDLSDYAESLEIARLAELHDSSIFADDPWRKSSAGQMGWELPMNLFHDAAVGAEDPILQALVGVVTAVVSVYHDGADAVGDVGFLGANAGWTDYRAAVAKNDMIKKSGVFRGNGSAGRAVLLHIKTQETITGNGTSVDNTASSSNGARANLHITAIAGTWTIKVQHSVDNSVFTDLITFSGKTAIGGSSGVATGTVNRYLRALWNEDVLGEITFVLGCARL